MKAHRLLFLTVSWAALMLGAGYTARADDAKHQQNAKTSDDQPGHPRASVKNHPRGNANLSKARLPKPLPSTRERSTVGKASVSQPLSNRPNVTSRGASIGGQTVSKPRTIHSAAVSRPSAPSPANLRHRSPNPATLGGSASPIAANTGALNGSRMSRRP